MSDRLVLFNLALVFLSPTSALSWSCPSTPSLSPLLLFLPPPFPRPMLALALSFIPRACSFRPHLFFRPGLVFSPSSLVLVLLLWSCSSGFSSPPPLVILVLFFYPIPPPIFTLVLFFLSCPVLPLSLGYTLFCACLRFASLFSLLLTISFRPFGTFTLFLAIASLYASPISSFA